MSTLVARLEDIPEGKGREFVVDGRIVGLFHVEGNVYAMDGLCPHAGGPIATGTLRGTTVTCPWHGWQFDVSNGKHCLTQNIQAATFPVEIRDGEIWVEMNPGS